MDLPTKWQKPAYQIIGQENQILQVLLLPNQQLFLDSVDLVYGSEHIYPKIKDLMMLRMLSWPRSGQSRKIKNTTESPQYFGIRRGSGKILCLDVTLYKELMVNTGKLLAINYQPDLKNVETNATLLNLALYKPLEECEGNMIFLQGNAETYIEKYLANGERMLTGKDNILCISKGVIVKKVKSNSLIVEGPGFVFVAAPESVSNRIIPRLSMVGLIFMLIVLLEILAMSILDIFNE